MPRIRITPHITEKSTALAKRGKYIFLVQGQASAPAVGAIVRQLYHVNPQKIAMVKIPPKIKGSRGRLRVRRGKVKAVVTLERNEKIADFEVEEKKK